MNNVECSELECRKSLLDELETEAVIVQRLVNEINNGKRQDTLTGKTFKIRLRCDSCVCVCAKSDEIY